jgi:hypothetical protein
MLSDTHPKLKNGVGNVSESRHKDTLGIYESAG